MLAASLEAGPPTCLGEEAEVTVTLPVCPSSAGPAGNTRPGARPAVSGSLEPLFFAKAFPRSNIPVFIIILDVYLENWIH